MSLGNNSGLWQEQPVPTVTYPLMAWHGMPSDRKKVYVDGRRRAVPCMRTESASARGLSTRCGQLRGSGSSVVAISVLWRWRANALALERRGPLSVSKYRVLTPVQARGKPRCAAWSRTRSHPTHSMCTRNHPTHNHPMHVHVHAPPHCMHRARTCRVKP